MLGGEGVDGEVGGGRKGDGYVCGAGDGWRGGVISVLVMMSIAGGSMWY